MKSIKRHGFTVVALLVLLLVAGAFLLPFINTAEAIPRDSTREKIGAYTGPLSGAAADDNIKAHNDLIKVDTVAILANQSGTGTTISGQRYISVVTTTDANDNDLFDVAGGAIIVESFIGHITTNIVAAAGAMKIQLDADAGWVDRAISTAVEMNGDLAGQIIAFSNANPAVLTPLTTASGGASTLMSPWYIGEGMVEMDNADEDATGVIQWIMVWTPIDDGTTVTAYGDGSAN